MRSWFVVLAIMLAATQPASAGPPFVTDDPEPTDFRHSETYLFNAGTTTSGGTSSTLGIDFSFGAAPGLQLTATVPFEYERFGGETQTGVGNIELAAKYRFLNQESSGWDASFFPRVFLPSVSKSVGERHAALLLPIWVGKDWGKWSTFGGGGCTINRGGGSRDFCQLSWALTHMALPNLQVGAEIFHQTPDSVGGRVSTGIGVGARFDLNDRYHVLSYISSGLDNANETNRASWYAAILLTL